MYNTVCTPLAPYIYCTHQSVPDKNAFGMSTMPIVVYYTCTGTVVLSTNPLISYCSSLCDNLIINSTTSKHQHDYMYQYITTINYRNSYLLVTYC